MTTDVDMAEVLRLKDEAVRQARIEAEADLCDAGYTVEQAQRLLDAVEQTHYNLLVYGSHAPPGPSPLETELRKLYEQQEGG